MQRGEHECLVRVTSLPESWGPGAGVDAATFLRPSPHPFSCPLSWCLPAPVPPQLCETAQQAGFCGSGKRPVGVGWGEGCFLSILPGLDAHCQGGPESGGCGLARRPHQAPCPPPPVVPATFLLSGWASMGLGCKFVAGRGGVAGASSGEGAWRSWRP